jgi:hypothetical protein
MAKKFEVIELKPLTHAQMRRWFDNPLDAAAVDIDAIDAHWRKLLADCPLRALPPE